MKQRRNVIEELLNDALAEFGLELDSLTTTRNDGGKLAAEYRKRCESLCVELFNDGYNDGKADGRYAPWP